VAAPPWVNVALSMAGVGWVMSIVEMDAERTAVLVVGVLARVTDLMDL